MDVARHSVIIIDAAEAVDLSGARNAVVTHLDSAADTLRYGEEHRVELEPGVELLIGLEVISEPDGKGMRTVMCILNGQLRPVQVRDRSVDAEVAVAERADRGNPHHIGAPFAGVVSLTVGVGDEVAAGSSGIASSLSLVWHADAG